MSQFIISPDARQDLQDITGYIALENPQTALRLRDRLFAAFVLLAGEPGLGHLRDDLVPRGSAVRFWPVKTYLVIYRAADDAIEIVRVLSGYRDISAIFGGTD